MELESRQHSSQPSNLPHPTLKLQIDPSSSSQGPCTPAFRSLNSASETDQSNQPLLEKPLPSPMSTNTHTSSKTVTNEGSLTLPIKEITLSLESTTISYSNEAVQAYTETCITTEKCEEKHAALEKSSPLIVEIASRTDSAYSTISPVLCEEPESARSTSPQERTFSKSNDISLSNSRVQPDNSEKLFRHKSFSASSVPFSGRRRPQKETQVRPLSYYPGFPDRGELQDPPELELDEDGFSPVRLVSASDQNPIQSTQEENNNDDIVYLSRRNTYAAPSSHPRNGTGRLNSRKVTKRMLSRVKPKSGADRGSMGNSNPARYGTNVGEGHNNYALMYNMLTGIRVSVSRCTAKVKRPLSRQDFVSANKLAFDITGNELTPSSKYDFKFKDYSPWVFRSLRELFGIDPAEYLLSLTLKYILSELSTPGKSGSFFYYSQDFRFIIKTVHHTEHKFFRKILPGYYEHVRANPDTLISRIYGLHRVKMAHTRKIHFVVMANVFPATKDIHAQFDLKGSTLGRFLDEKAASEAKLPPVLKDMNWLNQGRSLELGPEKRQVFFQQLRSDVDFLAHHNIMDYSLLLGVHNLRRGNRDKLRQATLSVFDPTAAEQLNVASQNYATDASDLRRQVASADPVALGGAAPHRLPQAVGDERFQCVFYRDGGGFLATNENNEPTKELYCMGIIDIMTPYSLGKKFEHVFKSIGQDSNAISAVDPYTYAHRFLSFLTKSISQHDDLLPALSDYGASHPSQFRSKQE